MGLGELGDTTKQRKGVCYTLFTGGHVVHEVHAHLVQLCYQRYHTNAKKEVTLNLYWCTAVRIIVSPISREVFSVYRE